MEDVRTTRFTPARFDASRTLSVPCTAGSRSSFCGSVGSSRVHGEATWKTPEQPLMAFETAVESRMLTGKIVMRDWASGWSVKR